MCLEVSIETGQALWSVKAGLKERHGAWKGQERKPPLGHFTLSQSPLVPSSRAASSQVRSCLKKKGRVIFSYVYKPLGKGACVGG